MAKGFRIQRAGGWMMLGGAVMGLAAYGDTEEVAILCAAVFGLGFIFIIAGTIRRIF